MYNHSISNRGEIGTVAWAEILKKNAKKRIIWNAQV